MNDNIIPLSLEDTFKFSCSNNIPCFNECCQDLQQFLTPYDILRLKNCLGIPSGLFLKQYTTKHTGPESGLPIITLKADGPELKCPFVTPSGCSVYNHRPSSCRMYPLARVVSRSRETGKVTEQYMLIKESYCLGHNQKKTWTIRQWEESQGVGIYNEMNDLLMKIISLKNRLMPSRIDVKSEYFFYMACYNLDTFRSHIFEKGILDNLDLNSETLNAVKDDDEALLKLGFQWIKQTLFSGDN
ncbi:MAG: YkgJ family cysteine cluster protein [Deltaproteobacteria bacterium]|nr:YkgJ family cysteine cluster protein [Deltaproteobacteria bacterium]MBW2660406.1 YkgJ family cysteine cluster protein [Deltaproteobacteria bacterium]